MSYYSTVMNQLLQLIPRHQFDNLVKKYEVDRYVRYFNCWQLFITLLYAQIWIAMIYYLLLSFIKFQTKYSYSLLDLSKIFEEAAMNMVNIIDLLSCKDYNNFRTRIREPDQQLTLSLTN